MLIRIHQYYTSLSPLKQLVWLFLLNGVFWFAAWSFYLWYFDEEYGSVYYRIMHAAWMSLVITIPLNWKKVNMIFKKQTHE